LKQGTLNLLKKARNNFIIAMFKTPDMELEFLIKKGKKATSHIEHARGINPSPEELFGY